MALRISNLYSKPIWVSLLYLDGGCAGTPWRKEGWWQVMPGQTRPLMQNDLRRVNQFVGIYAEVYRDDAENIQWSGSLTELIRDVGFNQCWADNTGCNQVAGFIELDFAGDADATMWFGPAAGQTKYQSGTPKIAYHQVGSCNGYPSEYGTTAAGSHAAYVTFKIESLDNSGVGAPFDFNPANLYTVDKLGIVCHVDPNLAYVRDIFGPFASAPATLSAYGAAVSYFANYCALIVHTTSADGASEADNTSYTLYYASDPSSITPIVTNSTPGRTSWPHTQNCRDIVLS